MITRDEIIEELREDVEIVEKSILPDSESSEYTYKKGMKGWTTAIFVDIISSTELFQENDEEKVLKIVRIFTKGLLEILRNSNVKVITTGIRGDEVFAIYSSSNQKDVLDLATLSCKINGFLMKLREEILSEYNIKINAGVGISTSEELVGKAGQKGTGINDLIWIGKSVTTAAKLASKAGRNGESSVLISRLTFNNACEYAKIHDESSFILQLNDNGWSEYIGSNWYNIYEYDSEE